MRLLSEGFRRVNARGEGIDYEAKQHSNLKFGTLIAGACISSFSMFTTTPALGQVEGKDFLPVTVGGQTESQMLQDFLAWALLNNTELYEKYKNSSTFDEVSVEDVLIWREDTEDPVLQITEISIGEIDIEDGETFTLTIGGLTITCTEGTDFTKTGDPETDKLLLLESLALKANQSGQLPTGYIVEVVDGKLVITGNGEGSFAVSVTSETNDTEFVVEKKQEFQRVESLLAGSFSLNASCQRLLIESRTTTTGIILETSASGELAFNRNVNSNISLNTDVTPYIAKVHERQPSASIVIQASIGTADYASTVFWNFMDVNWGEEDTSSSNQFFSTVHEGIASAGISMSVTVGQAGWASDFIWEGLDINWDDEVSGQFIQGNVNTSFSLFGTSTFVLADLENRTTSASIQIGSSVTSSVIRQRNASSSSAFTMTVGSAGWSSDLIWEQADVEWHLTSGQLIQEGASSSLSLSTNVTGDKDTIYSRSASSSLSLSTNVSGDIDTIFAINASLQFSLSTNINSELIQGWNSETTFVENLTRNWEAT